MYEQGAGAIALSDASMVLKKCTFDQNEDLTKGLSNPQVRMLFTWVCSLGSLSLFVPDVLVSTKDLHC